MMKIITEQYFVSVAISTDFIFHFYQRGFIPFDVYSLVKRICIWIMLTDILKNHTFVTSSQIQILEPIFIDKSGTFLYNGLPIRNTYEYRRHKQNGVYSVFMKCFETINTLLDGTCAIHITAKIIIYTPNDVTVLVSCAQMQLMRGEEKDAVKLYEKVMRDGCRQSSG